MKRIPFYGLLIALLALVGCGGGGGSSSGGSGNVGLFITDGATNSFDHVWVKIEKVDLSGPSGTRTLFDDPTGHVVDLKTLRDSSGGRFEFLGLPRMQPGTFSTITVTVDKSLVVFPTGSATGQGRVFAGFNAASGTKTLTASIPPTEIGSGNDDLVVDFDLDNWNDDGAQVTGSIRRGDDSAIHDLSRHEHADHHGTINNLQGTAPNFTFTITNGGHSFQVATDQNTTIFNRSGAENPVLANGQRVDVRGVFSMTTHTLNASMVEINDQTEDQNQAEANGTASNLDATAGTFTLTLHEVDNFVPDTTTITVATTSTTTFFNDAGLSVTKDEFFTALATATSVEVEGTYDAATHTLTATKLKIEDGEDHHDDMADVRGPASNINGGAGTFSVTAQHFEGLNISVGTVVNVVTDGSTVFRNSNGATVDAATFFAALTNGAVLEVEGTFDGTLFHATSVHFDDGDGHHGG